jgi:NAD(P)H-dependent FMN reductase
MRADISAKKPRLLILWHSRTGTARMLAIRMQRAAAKHDVAVQRTHATRARAADLIAADGVIFCAPENLGSLSGEMKAFFDRSYYACLERCSAKPYAQVIAAGSDGQGAVRQLARIATGLRLRSIAEPLIVITHAQTAAAIAAEKRLSTIQCKDACELAAGFAAGLAAGIY